MTTAANLTVTPNDWNGLNTKLVYLSKRVQSMDEQGRIHLSSVITLGEAMSLEDDSFFIIDDVDHSKRFRFELSGIATGTTRKVTMPDADGTATLLGNASTGSGSVVLATSPTIVTPTIASFTNATHNHTNAAGGGQLTTAALSDITPWTAVAYAAGDFTGNASMTWTVDSGDVTTFAYRKIGKMMTVAWALLTTSVGGTPSTLLQIKIPAGFTANRVMYNAYSYIDNGGARTIGVAFVNASGTNIFLQTISAGNWTASTNATQVLGQIEFETTA